MPAGRPKKPLNYELADELARIFCTQEEIASILGVSRRTLQRDEKFMEIYNRGIDEGKSSLRRQQWKAAQKGNTSMLIWLGKQYLGQRDKLENEDITNRELLEQLKQKSIDYQ